MRSKAKDTWDIGRHNCKRFTALHVRIPLLLQSLIVLLGPVWMPFLLWILNHGHHSRPSPIPVHLIPSLLLTPQQSLGHCENGFWLLPLPLLLLLLLPLPLSLLLLLVLFFLVSSSLKTPTLDFIKGWTVGEGGTPYGPLFLLNNCSVFHLPPVSVSGWKSSTVISGKDLAIVSSALCQISYWLFAARAPPSRHHDRVQAVFSTEAEENCSSGNQNPPPFTTLILSSTCRTHLCICM